MFGIASLGYRELSLSNHEWYYAFGLEQEEVPISHAVEIIEELGGRDIMVNREFRCIHSIYGEAHPATYKMLLNLYIKKLIDFTIDRLKL